MSLIGAVLGGRYRLTALIGEGGMGQVYRAETLDGARSFAIKVLSPEFSSSPEILVRFLDEGRAGLRMFHPNIVQTIEVDRAEDGSPFIVMELLVGVPLRAYTLDGKRVALGRAVSILQGILAGLAGAHAQGVIHRDLKPGNVHLARDPSGRFTVKLLDFGIAKVMDAAGGMGTKTATGIILGTPAYMSPEQIRSAKTVDHRSDLWAAGVLFYEMLAGRQAFAAPTEYARLSAVLLKEPDPIEQIDPSLACVSEFIRRALQKDREARFQSAGEMAQALAACVTNLPDTHPRPEVGWNPSPVSMLLSDPALMPPGSYLPVQSYGARPPGPAFDESTELTPFDSPDVTSLERPLGPNIPKAPNSNTTLASPMSPASVLPTSLPISPVRIVDPPRPRNVPLMVVATLVTIVLLVGAIVGFLVGRSR